MAQFLKKCIDYGVHAEHDPLLKEKIRSSNRLGLLNLLLVAPVTIICYLYYRDLVLLPILVQFNGWFILWLNKTGKTDVARIFATVLVPICVTLGHALLVPEGKQAMPAMFVIQVAFLMAPFVVFKRREPILLFPVMALNMGLLFFFEPVNAAFSLGHPDVFIREGYGYYLVLGTGMAVSVQNLLMWVRMHRNVYDRKADAFSKANDLNREIRAENARMKADLQEVSKTQKAERLRNWQNKGMADLSVLIRDKHEDQLNLDAILKFVVHYTGSVVGAIYKIDYEEEERIYMASCYAWERKKFVKKELEPNEGLVGQCYREGSFIHLTEIPENYIKIQAGSNEIAPKSLLLVPMVVNQRIEGVFELASIKNYQKYAIELVEQFGENLAIGLSAERANAQTRKLLHDAQESSEALKAQEEELRQNMEELAATQEEMERRNAERERLFEASEQKSQFILLLQEIIRELNTGSSSETAIGKCIDLICQHLQWPLGHAFLPDPKNRNQLLPTGIWNSNAAADFQHFKEETMKVSPKKGEGLTGRVYHSGEPSWGIDDHTEGSFPRDRLKKDLNIKTEMAFPIPKGDQVEGVLEFFAPSVIQPDEILLNVMTKIGCVLGNSIELYELKKRFREPEDK